MERDFEANFFRDNLSYIRLAYVLGAVVWAMFGVLAQVGGIIEDGRTADLVLRFGLAVPTVLVGLALTWTSWYPRYWRLVISLTLP